MPSSTASSRRSPPPATKRSERVAIVGGGPAGMSAAYYLARLGYPVAVFEAMPVPGGMMAIGIPEYRLPREVLREEIDRIVGLGVELHLDAAMGRDYTLADLEKQGFRAIFLATGASRSRRLGIDGEGLSGVVPATLFLKRVNLGENPRLSGHVVVVGGGSTAMDAARSACRSGAESVTIAYRRGRDEMPAQVEEIEAAEREGIVIRPGLVPVAVIGRDGAAVALRCQERRRRGGADGQADLGGGPRLRDGAPGSDGPRRDRRGTRPVDPPGGCRYRGQRVRRHRGRSAGRWRRAAPASSPVATSSPDRRPSSTRWRRADGRPAPSTSTCPGAVDGEKEIFATVRYATPPEPSLTLDLATRPRIHAPLPVDRRQLRSRPPRSASTMPSARSEASRCFRCDAVYGCPTVKVVAGRGPAGPTHPHAAAADAACHDHGSHDWRTKWRCRMNPDQVSGLFDAGESFVEGTIAAALVVLWVLAVSLHLARPYMVRTTAKFTLRLGADLWWIIYIGLRDIFVVQVFLGSFIFFYPDVISGQALPITGGLAAVCAFAVLLIKLMTRGDADVFWYRAQVLLLGLGSALYVVPYFFGSQATELHGQHIDSIMPLPRELDEPRPRPAAVLPLGSPGRHPRPGRGCLQPPRHRCPPVRDDRARRRKGNELMTPQPLSADDLAAALTNGAQGWLVLSVAAVLPILWSFTLVLHFARPYVLRFLSTLTLRFGGDVWWLSYVLFRDALLVITLGLSLIFVMPNLYLVTGLPITAPLATVVLLWALVVKLVRDPDEDPAAFRLLSFLLILASVLYIVPQVYGMEAADQEYLGSLPASLVSIGNLDLARPILWGSLGLIGLTGAGVFLRFLMRLGGPEAGSSQVE